MNRGDNRDRQGINFRHHLLPLTGQRFGFLRATTATNHVDIRPGNEVIGFSRNKHHAAQCFVIADLLQNGPYLRSKLRFQGVHFLSGHINGDNSNVIQTYV